MPTDPVCGMMVDEKTAAGTSTSHGTLFYFCSLACLQHFEAHPTNFIATDQRSTQPEARTEVEPPRSTTPATPAREMAKDPICGMVVEKAAALQRRWGAGAGVGDSGSYTNRRRQRAEACRETAVSAEGPSLAA